MQLNPPNAVLPNQNIGGLSKTGIHLHASLSLKQMKCQRDLDLLNARNYFIVHPTRVEQFFFRYRFQIDGNLEMFNFAQSQVTHL